jgi:hypothetical protein
MKSTLLLAVAGALVLLGSVAAVLTPSEPECRPIHGADAVPDGPLALDRAHVSADLSAIEVEAEQFSRTVARRPPASDSIDAREGARTAPQRAMAWCRASLLADLAVVHRTTEASLLAIGAGDAPQAETDRTNLVDATSPVVSRPSR